MKTTKREIKSARYLSKSPLVLSVVYEHGGSDTYTPRQMRDGMTDAACKYALDLAGDSPCSIISLSNGQNF